MATDLIKHEAEDIKYRLAPLPTPTPQAAELLTSPNYAQHVAMLNVAVEATLVQYFVRYSDEVIKRYEMEEWTIALRDWPIDQVRAALRQWVYENPRTRPNYGDIVGILKRRRGEERVKQLRQASTPSD